MLRKMVGGVPVLGALLRSLHRSAVSGLRSLRGFPGSSRYWEDRYAHGGTSGPGSYGRLAEFKAEVINSFVREHGIQTVIEFGCGDGNQLELLEYPSYLGFDVSPTAVKRCSERFKHDDNKAFRLMRDYTDERADVSLSLDVIFHLVEDDVFEEYMERLFRAASRFVIIYSSNFEANADGRAAHVRHRVFTDWIRRSVNGWGLERHIPNMFPGDGSGGETSFADFYVYGKRDRRGL